MTRLLTSFLAAGLALSLGAGALAQPATAPAPAKKEAPKDQPKKDDKPAAPKVSDPKTEADPMAAAGKPGAMHEWLKGMDGNWQAKVSEADASGKMTTSDGESANKMVYGGRFLEAAFKGRMSNGQFFYGTSIMGYNNADKQFQAVWYNSMSTSMAIVTGQVDSAGKVLTMTGEETNPADGKKMKLRWVFTLVAKDHYTFDYFMTMGGMPEMKLIAIDYTKGAAAKEEKKDEKEAKKEDKKTDKNEKK